MKKLDRDVQRRILSALADAYPDACEPAALGFVDEDAVWNVNAMYLAEHDLIDVKSSSIDSTRRVFLAQINARGLDFLQADGGLGAILDVVTVRFDADTLRAFIGDHVESSPMPAEEKSRVKAWLRTAGAETLKEATKRLVGAAIEHSPEGIRLLQNMLVQ